MRLLQTLLLAMVAATAASPLAALAAEPLATFPVVYNHYTPGLINKVVIQPETEKNSIAFRILNQSPEDVYLTNAQGEKIYIPIASERTVAVPYEAGKRYDLLNGEDKTVYSWVVDPKVNQETLPATSQETFSKWGSQLQAIIANNQPVYIPPYKQAETEQSAYRRNHSERYDAGAYSEPTRRPSNVRGYW
jgi:hypothetical protein